jgi:hypothetical protein
MSTISITTATSLALIAAVSSLATEISAQESLSAVRPGQREAAPLATTPAFVNRYVVPWFYSTAFTGTRSFAGIAVRNNFSAACAVFVRFRQGKATPADSDACRLSQTIPTGQSRVFCSRNPGNTLTQCDAICPGQGLTANAGSIIIGSQNVAGCERLAVDAQQFFTRDTSDTLIESQNTLRIVKFGGSNAGD